MKLKSLLEAKRKPLREAVVEPSEQILKGMLKELKMQTGINALVTLDKSTPTALYYMADLSKEIRTPVMRALFKSLTLDISCSQIPNVIGGYAFDISINYSHPQGGSNGKNLGVIYFQNNKFISKLY